MYPPERVKWFRERTLSLEHQLAYDNVSKRVPKNGEIFLDICCGTGELLKRVSHDKEFRLLIGTDATREMINIAQYNLARSGVEARITQNLRKTKSSRGVWFFYDDIVNSKIPLNYSDVTTLTFPEICLNLDGNQFSPSSWEEVERSSEQLTNEEILRIREMFYAEIIKRTKIGGYFVDAEYDTKLKDDVEEKDRIQSVLEMYLSRGLEVKSQEFFESKDVWDDAQEMLGDGQIPGYRIFVSRRIK